MGQWQDQVRRRGEWWPQRCGGRSENASWTARVETPCTCTQHSWDLKYQEHFTMGIWRSASARCPWEIQLGDFLQLWLTAQRSQAASGTTPTVDWEQPNCPAMRLSLAGSCSRILCWEWCTSRDLVGCPIVLLGNLCTMGEGKEMPDGKRIHDPWSWWPR